MFGHTDWGSQIFKGDDIIGCGDVNNLNYDPEATIPDGDRCGGCNEGMTRIRDAGFTCQEIKSRVIDCKTGEVYWLLKNSFSYDPPKDAKHCWWWNYRDKCINIKVRAIDNNGTLYLNSKSSKKSQNPKAWDNQKVWSEKLSEIKDKCGSIVEIPVEPSEVPNFFGPAPGENVVVPPAAETSNLSPQSTSVYVPPMKSTSENVLFPVKWLIGGAIAVPIVMMIIMMKSNKD